MLLIGALLVFSGCSSGTSAKLAHPSAPTPTTSAPTTRAHTTPARTTRAHATPVPTTPARTTPTVAEPCRGSPPPARWSRVVWIVMENRGLDQVEGSPEAPYLNRLGGECGLATDYSAVAHPSLPNYIALTSGSTQGIADDAGPDVHPLAAPSIFGLLGSGWRALEESMPAPCDRESAGEYAVKHNPAAYYTALASRCATQDVPLTDPPDLSAPFTFVTPNLCDDMHDCSTAAGDAWLAREVPEILASPEYRSGGTALFVTWDENDAGGTLVPLYVVAPSVPPGERVVSPVDHYSLLRTTEEMLGLAPLLGRAATAAGMRRAFHL
jgi:hypothetical protein